MIETIPLKLEHQSPVCVCIKYSQSGTNQIENYSDKEDPWSMVLGEKAGDLTFCRHD